MAKLIKTTFKKGGKIDRVEYRLNGELHRKNGPAVEYADGEKRWYLNGMRHRIDGPAVEYPDGTKYWYLNGEPHREDGPAKESTDGTKKWYLNGQLHREDGPAVEYSDGSKFWFLAGKEYSKHEYDKIYKHWYLVGIKITEPAFHWYWYYKGKFWRKNGPVSFGQYGWDTPYYSMQNGEYSVTFFTSESKALSVLNEVLKGSDPDLRAYFKLMKIQCETMEL